ncbi:1,6-anhydro-N-acetylmuramyl-L-alanine amidase [hydrothermal vent metagenome]|uniref:1,6-anhydro-N-acetylmuramyl-L-alanine amidase AmpD n=1 Tax=hydrothermal vent metagenome TaxID=652676 RepID=A0A3B0Z7W8_9ZZZZ
MQNINVYSGLIEGVKCRHSPNFNDRPEGCDIDMVVVHGISLPAGEFGGEWVDSLFLNKIKGSEHPGFAALEGVTVSSHLFIRRTGELIQYVPFNKRAWHAGSSEYEGRDNCNDFSIGIELEGTDDIAYEEAQYTMLTEVVVSLLKAYPTITAQRIVGHVDIAPGRKTDPGHVFRWQDFRDAVCAKVE